MARMKMIVARALVPLAVFALGGCVRGDGAVAGRAGDHAALQIIAFNDFHGHIGPDDQTVLPPGASTDAPRVKAGGIANLAAAVARVRADNALSTVVSAGDMISASPLVSGHFLDEPTIRAMNLIGVDFNALGNHEFDRGQDEIRRMQSGGCAQFTNLEPCRVMPDFPGANFPFLAANTMLAEGGTLFAPYGIKSFTIRGRTVRIGFVGLTLKGTSKIISAKSLGTMRFDDEAETANRLVPALREAGADILAVLIHEGANMKPGTDQDDCGNMMGGLPPVLAKLDPAYDLVISAHTHQAYVCNYGTVDPARPFLVTSAGQYGTLLTRISLDYDFGSRKLTAKRAENLLVAQLPDVATQQPEIAQIHARYQAAAEQVTSRPVGTLGGALTQTVDASGQSTLGNFIADAQLAAMAPADQGGAQLAFMNPGGLRAPITPAADGSVTFGALYAAQPFGNTLMVKALTGAQIRAALEQQFVTDGNRRLLNPSGGFAYVYDRSRPLGQRVSAMTLNGQPMRDSETYRVAMSNFLGQGGDGFEMFASAPVLAEGPADIVVLEAYVAARAGRPVPALDRIRNLTPQ